MRKRITNLSEEERLKLKARVFHETGKRQTELELGSALASAGGEVYLHPHVLPPNDNEDRGYK